MKARRNALSTGAVEGVIADALADPTLKLAIWAPEQEGYVDVLGQPVELPLDSDGRMVTRVTRDDVPAAALSHDRAVNTDDGIVEGLTATALMLLDNARLVQELRASRARIVETGERERRRLERDLHDGAQQRLVAIQVRLAMARELSDPAALDTQHDAIENDAQAALEELRALAHGSYLGQLQDLGPAAALKAVARSSPIPIRITDEGVGRSSEAIEAAIYFCTREAIQNAAKHAGEGATVAVTLARRLDALELTVQDDGVGMTPAAHPDGIGVTSMRDRIEAVGGQLDITSAPSHGTCIHATIPDHPT